MITNWSRRRRSLWNWGGVAILLAFILASIAPQLHAQIATTTATISGTVLDSTGAVVANASVLLNSAEKGLSRSFTTDSTGRYLFSQLPPAAYALTVKAKGFQTYEQKGIVLNAAQSATQDVSLTVGSESVSVSVVADASQLNTDNSNIAAAIDSKQIVELPLNLRNVYGLAELNSSVANTTEGQMLLGGGSNASDNADQDISFMNFGGGFFGTTAFLLDGSWDTDPEWGAVIFVPSVDAVQEFKIQNNSFTAQYGWSTGNVVNVVTKGGTNAFHGSAYEFYANEKLNSLNYFSTSQNALSRNQTGVSAGGPLYLPGLYKQTNKTFIFGLYEHFQVSEPSQALYTVPDTNFLNGDFSEILGGQGKDAAGNPLVDALGRPILKGQIYDPRSVRAITAGATDPVTGTTATATGYIRDPVPNNVLSNLAWYKTPDPVAAKILSYYPKPTASGVTNNLRVSGTLPGHSNEYNIRVDHNFNDQLNAYFRYSYKEEFKTGNADDWGDDPAGPGNARPNNRWGMWAGTTKIFSPTLTMNLTAGVQLWHETSDNQSFGFDPAKELGVPTYVTQNSPMFPMVTVGGESTMGPGSNDQQAVTNHGPVGTVAADFIKLAGKHTLSIGATGVEQVDSQHSIFTTQLNFNGGFTSGPDPLHGSGVNSGFGVAEMMMGVIDSSAANPTSVGTVYNPLVSNHLFGEYIQDDWKPTHNFTLNLGVRYEVQTPDTYRHNVASIFNPDELNPISFAAGRPYMGALQFLGPTRRNAYNTKYNNVAPRLGFSLQPTARSVVHGGYGIFFPQSVTCCWPGDADGFSATTYVNTSLDGGITPNPNISLASPWAGNYAQITGNTNGEYQQVGNGVGSVFRTRPSPYVQQWMLGVQYALTPSDQLDVDYIGNRGVRMVGGHQYNQLDPKYLALGADYLSAKSPNPMGSALATLEQGGTIAPSNCNLDQATVINAQLLSPFPQYCNAAVSQTDAPVGQSLYSALQVTYNHRISKGLTALVSYTYSKFLDNVEGNNSWSYNGPGNWGHGAANNYNMAAEKSVDAGDVPQALVASYTYELPVGRGKQLGSGMNRIANSIAGGWEISGIATFRKGIPIGIFGNDYTSYGGDPRPDVTGNVHAAHQTLHEWFNTGAFKYADYGTFGTAPRYFSNLRGPGYQNWDTTLEKNWVFKDRMRAQFRFETFNTFNHPNFYAPGAGSTVWQGCDPNADSTCSSSFGQVTAAFPARSVQWAGKFYW